MVRRALLMCVALGASSAAAQAISFSTKLACSSDYYAFCAQHSIGTPGVRKCMRVNGPKLSKGCINALIADGEVSAAEVEREKQRLAGKGKTKLADGKTGAAAKREAEDKTADAERKKRDEEKKRLAESRKRDAEKVREAEAKQKPRDAEPKATKMTVTPLPRSEVVRAPEGDGSQAREPGERTVTVSTANSGIARVALDDEVFAALKTRESRFVIGEDAGTQATADPYQRIARPDADNTGQPSAADLVRPEREAAPAESAAPPRVADQGSEPSARIEDQQSRDAAEYPAGRMALGRKLADPAGNAAPTGWWDKLVRLLTGGGE